MSEIPENMVVRKAREGNREAFDQIFSQHATALQLFIRYRMGKLLRGNMESMDLVQDVYLQAMEGFAGFHGKGHGELFRWLCGIAKNRMSDHRRRAKAQKRGGEVKFARRGEESTAEEPVNLAPAEGPGPRTVAILREEGARMEEAFAGLSERDQQIIGLRHFEGLSARETGKEMGMKEGTVNVVFFRAMQRWQEKVEGEE